MAQLKKWLGLSTLTCDQCPIVQKNRQETVVDQRMIDHQDHLAVDLVADLAPIEAAHRAPRHAIDERQEPLGMDAAAGRIADRTMMSSTNRLPKTA